MCLIVYRWMLRDPTLEVAGPVTLANKLNSHPPMSVWLAGGKCLWNSACADLRHNPEKIDEANGNADKTTDLSNSVTHTVNKHQSRQRRIVQLNCDRSTLDILNNT